MRKKSSKRGFTLVELIVMIAIIAILALIMIPVVSCSVEANARALYSAVSYATADDKDVECILEGHVKSDDVVFYSLDYEGYFVI